jgi:hypothetical protein
LELQAVGKNKNQKTRREKRFMGTSNDFRFAIDDLGLAIAAVHDEKETRFQRKGSNLAK